MRTANLTVGKDATTKSALPNTAFPDNTHLYVWDNGSGGGGDGWLFFAVPFPQGAVIQSATLSLYNIGNWSGSHTVSLNKVTSSWGAQTITWNTTPTVGAQQATLTKSAPVNNTRWDFDVTAHMQAVANGDPWFGWKINGTGSTAVALHGFLANYASLRPVLHLVWAERPFAPSDLTPRSDQVVSKSQPWFFFNFQDSEGAASMRAYQIQIKNSVNDFTTPTNDFTVNSTAPQSDLSTIPVTLTANIDIYWRVRVKDDSNLWSNWSTPVRFKYVTKGSLTINAPTQSSTINDDTPTITWTYTPSGGFAQERYEIIIHDASVAGAPRLYTSGQIIGTATSFTVPSGVIKVDDHIYRAYVRVWDTANRMVMTGDTTYVQQGPRDWTWDQTTSLAPATSFTVTFPDPLNTKLNWSYAIPGNVDYFRIFRNGVLIAQKTPAEVADGGTYTYYDYLLKPRSSHTWTIVTHGLSLTSANNPSVSKTVGSATPKLVSFTDTSQWTQFVNGSADLELLELSDVAVPIAGTPVLTIQDLKSYMGTFSGEIASELYPTSTQVEKDKVMAMRETSHCYFIYADLALEVYIYNVQCYPLPIANGKTDYQVSFQFIQVGGLQ